MDRFELPPPPPPRPFRFPLPPAPRVGAPRPPGGVPSRRRDTIWIAIGLAFVLVAAIAGAAGSVPSNDDRRPLFGSDRSHAFIGRSANGDPFRWDPCSPIRYQVDLGRANARVLRDVREAVRRTSAASGLRFRFEGLVHVSVADLITGGDFVTAGRGGLHWAPVLIAFRSRTALRDLGVRRVLGVTFPVTSRFDADQFVSGAVVINTDGGMREGFGPGPSLGATLQHELGHVVGLGHILDPFQLMSPVPVMSDWGRGDLAGLQQLGQGPCLDVPTAELDSAIVPHP